MKEGDWIRVPFISYTYYGYVEGLDQDRELFRMRYLKRIQGDGTVQVFENEHIVFHQSRAVILENVCAQSDYAAMIDLALMTGDEEWFHELIEAAALHGEEPLEEKHELSEKGLQNTHQSISETFSAIGQAFKGILEGVKERFSQLAGVMQEINDSSPQESRTSTKSRLGWHLQEDTRRPSQVLDNKPKFVIRNLI